MEAYKNRFPQNKQKQDAYENACDCLSMRIPFKRPLWAGLDKYSVLKIWTQALYRSRSHLRRKDYE